jgi:hypothetical protein
MAKYLLIAAALISLVTAGLGYKNYTTLTETKDALASTQATLVTTKKNLDAKTKDLTTTTATLTATTADKDKANADLAAAQGDRDAVKAKLKEATDAKAATEAQLASVQSDFEKYKGDHPDTAAPGPNGEAAPDPRIAELEALVTSLQGKLKTNEDTIANLQAQDEKRRKGLMKEGLEGRVLAVNPAWNFVVLSIGDRQGVVNNAEMLLKRGGQYLGKVRITSVEPSTSIADIVANTLPTGVAVQPGDSVIFQSAQTTEN